MFSNLAAARSASTLGWGEADGQEDRAVRPIAPSRACDAGHVEQGIGMVFHFSPPLLWSCLVRASKR